MRDNNTNDEINNSILISRNESQITELRVARQILNEA